MALLGKVCPLLILSALMHFQIFSPFFCFFISKIKLLVLLTEPITLGEIQGHGLVLFHAHEKTESFIVS